MRLAVAARSILIVLVVGARAFEEDDEAEEGDEFTNEWVAEIQGGEHVARRVARDHGFSFNGLVEPFEDHYILTRDDHPEISTRHSKQLTRKLLSEDEVKWAEQQALLKIGLRVGNSRRQTFRYDQPENHGLYSKGGELGQQGAYYAYQQQLQETEYPQNIPRVSDAQLWADFDEATQFGGGGFGRPSSSWMNRPVTSISGFGGRLGGGGWSGWSAGQSRPQGGTWSSDGATYTYEDNKPGYSMSYVETSYGRPMQGVRPSSALIDDDYLNALTSQLQGSLGMLTGGMQATGLPRPRPRPRPPSFGSEELQTEYLPSYPAISIFSSPSPFYNRPPAAYYPQQPPQGYYPSPYQRPPSMFVRPPPPQTYSPPPQPQYVMPPQTYSPPPQPQYVPPPQTYSPPPQPHYVPPPQTYSPPPPPQPPPYVRPPPGIGGQRPSSGSPQVLVYDANGNLVTDPVLLNYLANNPNMRPGQPFTFDPSEAYNSASAANQGDLSNLGKFGTGPVDAKILETYKGATPSIELLSAKTSAYKDQFTDPLWNKQWYCHDYRTVEGPVMDHNVVPVYKMGETGKGIKVAVVDDGCELHPDIMPNMMQELNYDMNTRRPGARPESGASHGTKCAGEIAMVANNGICGVGIAYDVKFAAVKKEGHGAMTMMFVEGSSLAYKTDVFDIYSNSWGPPDDGSTLEDIGHLNLVALKTGYSQGRGGKGAVYTFAGGNGRHDLDNCGADGFVNSLYTLGIAGASQRGKVTYYSERCSAILATSYSGHRGDEAVASIDIGGRCTTTFSGTSAAVPIATGIIALVLGANKDLISRDIVHLTALTSEVAPLASNPDSWYKNGAGFWVSNDFGFGLFNAENMVNLAKKWKPIGERHACELKVKFNTPEYLAVGRDVSTEFETKGCADNPSFHVASLEEVLFKSVIEYPYRGALSIHLTSPMGTKTDLLETRPKDTNRRLNNWEIKSFHNWGENPAGKWLLEVKANQLHGYRAVSGYVFAFSVVLMGTANKPWYHGEGMVPRKYSAFRLPDGKTG